MYHRPERHKEEGGFCRIQPITTRATTTTPNRMYTATAASASLRAIAMKTTATKRESNQSNSG